MVCFGNGALINVNIWNQNIPQEIQYKWLLFDGFKLKFSGPDSMCLSSSVYSKTQMMMTPSCEQYSNDKEYKNLSSLVQERNVTAINALSQLHERVFSKSIVVISDIKVCEYDGCGKCRRKLTETGNCENCGLASEIEKKVYKYIVVEMGDGDSVMYASVFNEEIQKGLLEWNLKEEGRKFDVFIKSKNDLSGEAPKASHIVSKLAFA